MLKTHVKCTFMIKNTIRPMAKSKTSNNSVLVSIIPSLNNAKYVKIPPPVLKLSSLSHTAGNPYAIF